MTVCFSIIDSLLDCGDGSFGRDCLEWLQSFALLDVVSTAPFMLEVVCCWARRAQQVRKLKRVDSELLS
jgi:hypothetical protein